MGQESQKLAASEVVRIWKGPKKQLEDMANARTKRERRPVSEAEVASKAIEALFKKDRKKLGL